MNGIPTGPDGQRSLAPDWVMLGVPMEDGQVMLLASKELTYAELVGQRERAAMDEFLSGRRPDLVGMSYHVRAGMKTFVLIVAATYEAAFSHLFTTWKPEPARRPQVEPAHRALPAVEAP